MNITWGIFPKFYKHLGVEELAELIHHVGLDTTNAVIRDGYWVTRDTIAESLPAFVKAMSATGLKVHFATAGFMPDECVENEHLLGALADAGLREFRMGYFRWDGQRSPAECMDDARRGMSALVSLCEKHDLRAVYQVHHDSLIAGPWAAWQLVHDLPARYVGVMLDPGNQVFEGWDNWPASARLLGEHLVAMGIKDADIYRNDDRSGEGKGWQRRLGITLQEGVTNWQEVMRAIKTVDFDGTFVYMPFYDTDAPEAMTAKLKAEVEYLRGVVQAVETEEA